jgi:hypothetical protein
LKIAKIKVNFVHFIFHFEEDFFILVLCFKFEAF